MRNVFSFLRKKSIYVKPMTSHTEMFGWLTLNLSTWQSFWDDCHRYGLPTAIHNLRIEWRHYER